MQRPCSDFVVISEFKEVKEIRDCVYLFGFRKLSQRVRRKIEPHSSVLESEWLYFLS